MIVREHINEIKKGGSILRNTHIGRIKYFEYILSKHGYMLRQYPLMFKQWTNDNLINEFKFIAEKFNCDVESIRGVDSSRSSKDEWSELIFDMTTAVSIDGITVTMWGYNNQIDTITINDLAAVISNAEGWSSVVINGDKFK